MSDEIQNPDVETIADIEGPHKAIGEESMNDVYDAIAERVQNASDFDEDAMELMSNAPDEIPNDWEITVATYKSRESETYDGVFIWVTPSVETINAAAPDYLNDLNRSRHVGRLTDTARRFILDDESEGEPNFPQTVRQFVTRASSGIAAVYSPAFDAMYPMIKDVIKSQKVYNLSKRETLDCFTNAKYAAFHYPNAEKDNLFVKLAKAAIARIDMEATEDKPKIMDKKGVVVTSDWFKAQLEARDQAEFEVEEQVTIDEDFTF